LGLLFVLSVAASVALVRPTSAATDEAKTAPFVGYTKYLRYDSDFRVNADGTDVETDEFALKVLTEQGVAAANQAFVRFSDRLQDATILSAYTLKADGRRIDAPPTNFQVQSNTGKGKAAPIFSDIRTKTVALPDVAVGDTIVFSYRVTAKEAVFPGNFSMLRAFSPYQVFDEARITLSAPASLEMRVYTRAVKGGEVGIKNGRREWSWTYRNPEIIKPEPSAVSILDDGPLVVASTFKDYGALGAAYDSRARAKAKVTPQIKHLADEVTGNAATPRDQAKAIYDWVATNITYAPNAVGQGSVVPHDADEILANKMGDCKDHTALMKALLAAKGIASVPVLINGGLAYALPPAPSADII
jgi:transglutaminase-like putative cysteine protease